MKRVDRERIEALLQDDTLSFRAIARESGCSDWSVRSIARQLSSDPRPMKDSSHQSAEGGVAGYIVVFVLIAIIGGMFWFTFRTAPPQSGPTDR